MWKRKERKKRDIYFAKIHVALIHNIPEHMLPTVIFLPKC